VEECASAITPRGGADCSHALLCRSGRMAGFGLTQLLGAVSSPCRRAFWGREELPILTRPFFQFLHSRNLRLALLRSLRFVMNSSLFSLLLHVLCFACRSFPVIGDSYRGLDQCPPPKGVFFDSEKDEMPPRSADLWSGSFPAGRGQESVFLLYALFSLQSSESHVSCRKARQLLFSTSSRMVGTAT